MSIEAECVSVGHLGVVQCEQRDHLQLPDGVLPTLPGHMEDLDARLKTKCVCPISTQWLMSPFHRHFQQFWTFLVQPCFFSKWWGLFWNRWLVVVREKRRCPCYPVQKVAVPEFLVLYVAGTIWTEYHFIQDWTIQWLLGCWCWSD